MLPSPVMIQAHTAPGHSPRRWANPARRPARLPGAAIVAAGLMAAAGAAGQVEPTDPDRRLAAAGGAATAELPDLPSFGRELPVRGGAAGQLTDADHPLPVGGRVQAWTIRGVRGTRVYVDATSTDFDVRLYLHGPGLSSHLRDEDGAGNCNARLGVTFPETGDYQLLVASGSPGATGRFRLHAGPTPGPERPGRCAAESGETALEDFLAELPVGSRSLAAEGARTGLLGTGDARFRGGRYQAWRFRGRGGERVTFALASEDFDAFLYVVGPGLDEAVGDDDGGDNCNARIELTLPRDGDFRVIVTTADPGAEGEFVLAEGDAAEEPRPGACGEDREVIPDLFRLDTGGRVLTVGRRADGRLTASDDVLLAGSRLQAWSLPGTAGEEVTIDLRSDDFDAFLFVLGPGLPEPLVDDDGAGRCDARVTVRFPEDGSYRVVVNSLMGGEGGRFTLLATRDPGPPSGGACSP